MTRRLVMATTCITAAALVVACNSIAGIADLQEVDPSSIGDAQAAEGGDVGDVGGSADVNAVDVTNVDAAGEGATPTSCPVGELRLQITVIASPSNAYVGVEVHGPPQLQQNISANETRTICATSGDAIDLRGQPDSTSALHRWDGTTCGTQARCKFTMQNEVIATVHLQ